MFGTSERSSRGSLPSLLAGCMMVMAFPAAGSALIVEVPVGPDYVRKHAQEWSVKVVKQKNGLIQFTVVRTLTKPKHLLADLAVNHAGKPIATSETPLVGKKGNRGNAFRFSLSAADVAESTFTLSESGLLSFDGAESDLPEEGGECYRFRLSEFVPQEMFNPAAK